MRLHFTDKGVEFIPGPDKRLTMMRSRLRALVSIAFAAGMITGGLLLKVLLGTRGVL